MNIVLDRFDRQLLNRIYRSGCVLLADLNAEFAQVPYHTIRYRVETLAKNGYIELYKGRNSVKCAVNKNKASVCSNTTDGKNEDLHGNIS